MPSQWKKPREWEYLRREDVANGYRDLFGLAVAPQWDAFSYSPSRTTLADELRNLRSWVRKNDRDPLSTLTGRHLPENRCTLFDRPARCIFKGPR